MNFIKWLFTSKYKKLLYRIEAAKNNSQRICLPNGILIDFSPGHEYDDCKMFAMPREYDGENFYQKYIDKVGQIVHINVYDCFGGNVRILAVGEDTIFVEVVDIVACYACQRPPRPGSKYWVGDWEIEPGVAFDPSPSVFTDKDLPF